MTYEPLHHKYRPQTFAELVGQEAIAATLTNALRQQKIAPAYLFTGARGTGKTSSARILAKSLNCLSSQVPTEQPCGQCEVCRAIAKGNALDVIEIDAASNTGVDNIRELIERAQFAPVQCRYKVYVVDECLTGDTLVQTINGLVQIDDPNLLGKQVLSYSDELGIWEYKKVLRWLDQGDRQTLVIKTTHRTIRCTSNHLIRTDQGWIPAKDVKEGAKILSPVNVAAAHSSTSSEVVKAVRLAGVERVYDIEVEDNHNFVANGLLVHNCHMLSTAAFNALLKTLEEPPNQVVFVLATTDPQRVLPTIISRCQRFDFRRISLEAMVQHLGQIANLETIPITNEAITLVAQIAQGGLRDAESLLDQLSLSPGKVTVDQVWDLVGSVPERDLLELVQAISNDNPETVLDSTRRLMDRGREPLIVLQNLASFYRDLLIAKTAPARNDLVAITPPTWQQLCELAQSLDVATILAGQQHLRSAEVQLKNTTQPRLWLEVTLMGLLPSAIAQSAIAGQQQPFNSSRPQVTPFVASPSVTQPVRNVSVSSSSTPASVASAISGMAEATTSPRAKEIEKEPVLQSAEPESQVEASTNAVQDSQPTADSTTELDQIWRQVVSHLHPLSKALLNDYGRLLAFDGQTAQIGISTEKLLKIAQNQSKNIEKAFLDVFQQKVKISLEVSSMATPRMNFAEAASGKAVSDRAGITSLQNLASADHSAVSGAIAPPSEHPPTIPPTSTQNHPSDQASSQPSQSSLPPANQPRRNHRQSSSPAEPPPAGKDAKSQTQAAAEPTLKSWEEDEGIKAAKQLAEFFAGKVVSANDDLSVSSDIATEITELELDSEAAIAPAWSHSTAEEGVDNDDDDDVPF